MNRAAAPSKSKKIEPKPSRLCRSCEAPFEPFVSFGRMPLANGFLPEERFKDEYFFELAAAFCSKCHMVQLVDQPAPEAMFNENYAFFSGTSKHMAAHFKRFAEGVLADWMSDPDPFVVEMGSNDGIMLRNFAERGIRHLGIEPSANVAEAARKQGVNTISKFFGTALAKEIVAEHGQADAFLAANVTCHIPAIREVAAGAKLLLKPKGVMLFEDPYLGAMIEKTSYDQIYDEHVFIFSAHSIAAAFRPHGLELVDCLPQTTHGGSMRYAIAHKGARPASPRVAATLAAEKTQGLTEPATYSRFREKCERSKAELRRTLEDFKKKGKRVAGYAATSKSTTILNYCGIGPDLLEFISDTTPIKQGKFSPGMHVPVRPYDEFKARYPDYALLFAWNHFQEVSEKEQAYRERGGKWILHVPEVHVL